MIAARRVGVAFARRSARPCRAADRAAGAAAALGLSLALAHAAPAIATPSAAHGTGASVSAPAAVLPSAAASLARRAASGAAAAAPVATRPEPSEPAPLVWRHAGAPPGSRDAEAVALHAPSGRIVLGDARGVWLWSPGEPWRRVLGRGPVRELRFDARGRLLAATDRGLYAVEPEGGVRKLRLAAGGKASRVRRLALAGGVVAVGTEAGVQVAPDGEAFARLDGALPDGPVDALALRALDGGGLELWASIQGALHRAELARGPHGLAVRASEPVVLAESPGARAALDLAVDVAGADVAVLSETDVALLREGVWRSRPLALGAGARARRLGRGAGRLFVATDAGIVEARAFEGPWRRAAGAAGAAGATALAGDAARAVAASERGLLEAVAADGAPADVAASGLARPLGHDDWLARLEGEPAVQDVHAAALRYLGLGPERLRALARRADRRGWLPVVELRGGAGRGRALRIHHDQVVTSGLAHDLLDRQLDRGSDYEGSLSLAWDLGDLVFQPDALDVSREAREVIELRDEVLDEVTQLYYERRRVLLALRQGAGDELELARLRVRADELAAGLDAWTGGWFSRRAAPLAASRPAAFDSPPPSRGVLLP